MEEKYFSLMDGVDGILMGVYFLVCCFDVLPASQGSHSNRSQIQSIKCSILSRRSLLQR